MNAVWSATETGFTFKASKAPFVERYKDQFGVLSGIITQHNITDPANNESDYRFQDEGKYDSCGICSNRCKKPNQKQE